MMLSFKKLLILILLININTVSASVVDIFSPIEATPPSMLVNTLSKPENFSTINNLTRIVGSFYAAVGEPLYIKGTITDAFGVPIEGATVKIWQTNASGKYQSLQKPESVYIDKNFLMSGTAKTDNLGNYGFFTVFPGYFADRAPHINIVISGSKFETLTTEIYFKDHPRNEGDPQYMSYSKNDRKKLTANVTNVDQNDKSKGKVATFNVVIDIIHQYKGY